MVKIMIGVWPNLTIEVEGETFPVLKELAFWDSVPHECPVRISESEVCGQPLHFTYRAPTVKEGPKRGQTFEYAGLECIGNPAHECQFSQRADKSGIFIRTGNRQDGKPNWRLAYKIHEDDEPEYESPRESLPSRQTAPQQQSTSSRTGNVPAQTPEQFKELLRLGKSKGYDTEDALNVNCQFIYNKNVNELDRAQAIEYYRTLREL